MWAHRTLWLVFAWVAAYTLYSVPKLAVEQLLPEFHQLSMAVALAFALVAVGLAWWLQYRLGAILCGLDQRFGGISSGAWITGLILIGGLLRVAWVIAFPAELTSDFATYFGLAAKLYENGEYETAGFLSYWPPGYPLFLYLNFLFFGVHTWVPTATNLVLFALTVVVVFRLAKLIAGTAAARLATLLLTFWPSYLTSVGIARKEGLIILFIPLVLYLYLRMHRSSLPVARWSLVLGCGLLIGYASLTQPSFLLFPCVLLAYDVLMREKLWAIMLRALVLGFAMALVIAPWTYRNFQVHDTFVLISTNGGDVFYRANNPLATGGYTKGGERDLDGYHELTASRLGKQWGREWIVENPLEFLSLALRKQLLFTGDDSTGIYETLKRGSKQTSVLYMPLKALSNAYWWGLWIVILSSMIVSFRTREGGSSHISLLMLSFLYPFAMHSVFESGSQHHLAFVGPLAVLVAVLVSIAVQHRQINRTDVELRATA